MEIERLAEAQLALPPSLILVPVDFERDDLGETLVGAGFQQNSPALFTWLGVVPYLTQEPGGEAFLRCTLEEGSLDDDQIKELEGEMIPDLNLYLYGRLIYESVGTVGVNQFCYRWENRMGFSLEGDKPGFIKDGPAAYNSHT